MWICLCKIFPAGAKYSCLLLRIYLCKCTHADAVGFAVTDLSVQYTRAGGAVDFVVADLFVQSTPAGAFDFVTITDLVVQCTPPAIDFVTTDLFVQCGSNYLCFYPGAAKSLDENETESGSKSNVRFQATSRGSKAVRGSCPSFVRYLVPTS